MALNLQPLNAAELLDRTFSLYRKHFPLFVGIVTIPMLVYFLGRIVFVGIQSSSPADAVLTKVFITVTGGLILIVIQLFASLLAQGATTAAVSDVYLEQPSDIGKAYARLRGNLLNILFAMIFMGFVIGFGFLLLIVPGVIFMAAFALTIPATVIEKLTPVDAMRRSWELTKEGRWRVLIVLIIAAVLANIIALIFQVPGLIMAGFSAYRDPSTIPVLPRIVMETGSFIALCLVTPLGTIASSLLYYDQRVRKEGFDLQFMISSLESKEKGEEAPHQGIF